jgi:hypothetical protein
MDKDMCLVPRGIRQTESKQCASAVFNADDSGIVGVRFFQNNQPLFQKIPTPAVISHTQEEQL